MKTTTGDYSRIRYFTSPSERPREAFIGSGADNTVSGNYGAVLGGLRNSVSHNYSAAFGLGVISVKDCAFHANNFVAQNMAVAPGPPGSFYIHSSGGVNYVAIS